MSVNADIGLIGLAVMGRNLVLNMNDHGYRVAVYNRTLSKIDEFLEREAKATQIIAARSLKELVSYLKKPRKVIIMVKAGKAVDDYIDELLPFLDKEDIIIDGGNSHYIDTMRRVKECRERGILYVGAGISGGEQGARFGPSIMPGGEASAWPHIKEILQSIAAKTPDGLPCCEWMGEDGAGHFVKMVHNGIEYGDMQLIAEAYHCMKEGLAMSNLQMHKVFSQWNRGQLDSYLIEITANILATKEEGEFAVDRILDVAHQKGTGKWTSAAALELEVPMTLVTEAVFFRYLSALKQQRLEASAILNRPPSRIKKDKNTFIKHLGKAMYASKIVSYAQGFMLLRQAAEQYGWKLNYGNIALVWRGGCIIRSRFLEEINKAFVKNPDLKNILLDNYFKKQIRRAEASWRFVIASAVESGLPLAAMASALAFYDAYRRKWLPANLIQAQRDYFGAHTYERTDKQRGQFFHTNWIVPTG